jgi:lysophospholipase
VTLTAAALWFRGADKARLRFEARDATPVDAVGGAHAAFVTVHGAGEHMGKYEEWAAHATAHGFHVMRYDQRGHGRTPGRRGHYRFGDLVVDLARFVEVTADRYPEAPIFLLGHSLGALVVLRYAAGEVHEAVRGAVLTGPPIAIHRRDPTWRRWGIQALARLAPSTQLSRGATPGEHTRDPERVAAFASDPLIHHVITPRAMVETAGAIEAVRDQPEAVRLPLLVLLAWDDAVVSGPEAREYFRRVASRDVTIAQVPGARHEVLQELGRGKIFDQVCAWSRQRAAR